MKKNSILFLIFYLIGCGGCGHSNSVDHYSPFIFDDLIKKPNWGLIFHDYFFENETLFVETFIFSIDNTTPFPLSDYSITIKKESFEYLNVGIDIEVFGTFNNINPTEKVDYFGTFYIPYDLVFPGIDTIKNAIPFNCEIELGYDFELPQDKTERHLSFVVDEYKKSQ